MAKNNKVSAVSQFKAITFKTITLQVRQRKTNVCQVLYPTILMLILLLYQLMSALFQIGGGMGTLQEPQYFSSSLNATWNCSAYIEDTTCGTWNHLYFSNSPDSSLTAGQLYSNSSGSGMLGYIPQLPYQSENITLIFTPFFDEKSSPTDIDNEIYEINTNQTNAGDNEEEVQISELELPTAAINFLNIETSTDTNTLQWELQVTNKFELWPNNTISDTDLRSSYYISMIDSAFANLIYSQFPEMENLTISISPTLISLPYYFAIPIFNLTNFLAIFYVPVGLGFSLPVFVYMLVLERTNRILVMMKMMGLKNWQYRLANYLIFYVYYAIFAIFISVFVLAIGINLFWSVNPLSWIILYIFWGFGLVSFSFFLASLFNGTRSATITAYLIVMFGFTIGFYGMLFFFPDYNQSSLSYYLFLLVPPFAFMRGEYLIGISLSQPLIPDIGFSDLLDLGSPIWVVYWFLIFDAIIYFLVGSYLDNVLPKTFGVSEHPLYPLQSLSEFIRGKVSKIDKVDEEESQLISKTFNEDEDCVNERKNAHDMNYECFVRIRNVVKEYIIGRGNKKVALDHLSLTIKEGETFGLLGPNGAGKTTLASIMSGLATQTSGSLIVNGQSVPKDMDDIYKSLGFCPQHDILWDELTIAEHLLFYCRLRGIKNEKEEVESLTRKVNLHGIPNKKVNELSGGMKRRLSLAIALVGSPSLVLLDEPTTGLDPVSRRAVWDIINDQMDNRCTIITTHNMEEADALCSRIGIVAKGRLRCVGTQLHLKNKFGTGYKLTLTVTDPKPADDFIKSIYPNAVLNDTVGGGAVTYEIRDPNFSLVDLFREMKDSDQYGILEWGINQSSLEDVFLNIVEQTEQEDI